MNHKLQNSIPVIDLFAGPGGEQCSGEEKVIFQDLNIPLGFSRKK